MKELAIETFPLDGRRLIEASAGTGKTYTIAGLYLRLLLDREKALTVTNILVVTFTEAATQELRGRIRQRLYAALRWLEGKTEQDELSDMLSPYREDAAVIQKLRDSITCMDEAAIFTIHGFCQRTLTDSAFESGAFFDVEFVTDESHIRLQVVRDFWRNHVVGSDRGFSICMANNWKQPEDLLAAIDALIRNPGIEIQPAVTLEDLESKERERQVLFTRLKALWLSEQTNICTLLNDSPDLSRAAKNYKPVNLQELYGCMNSWVEADLAPSQLPQWFELFTRSKIEHPSSLIKKKVPPEHDFFELADQLQVLYAAIQSGQQIAFMLSAACYISSEIEGRKEKSRLMFFDDLLAKLDKALQSPEGTQLAGRINTRYPVAMIDEFQDTDPLQYRIFHRIYADCSDCGLFMIGDPKQAIYSFRGADIFTYMQARHDTDAATGHFTLKTNWRSHTSLVNAVNALFDNASAQFIYENEIQFHSVKPAGKADKEPLLINGKPPFPMVCWLVPMTDENTHHGSITRGWARPAIATGCAAEIASLLNQGQRGAATIADQRLTAHDIAVLVRDRFEAAEIRYALGELGIASVYISRDSVFDTEEARDMSHLLRAVAEPSNTVLLRTALATTLVGMTARNIHDLYHDETGLEAKVLAFQTYLKTWNRVGFMPMLHTLLRDEGVIARLLSLPDGERRMTNLLQLAELAQVASQHHTGVEGLLRWLSDQRSESNGNSDDQQLRMESDEDLVQIVTIHKSKGLEYPIVFLPYIWASKDLKAGKIITYHDETDRSLHADIGSKRRNEVIELAGKERLAEDLRLLYVAITRAKFRCYFSWGKFNGADKSGLAWLLHQQQDEQTGAYSCNMATLDDSQIRAALNAINKGDRHHLSVEDLPGYGQPFRLLREKEEQPQALSFTGTTAQSWRMTSFSGLTASSDHGSDYRVELPDHDLGLAGPEPVSAGPRALSRFSFPRGTQAGLFLHQLFENIDFPTARGSKLATLVQRGLEQYGFETKWSQVVTDWLGDVLDTRLDETLGLSLRQVSSDKRLVELEFHFPLKSLAADHINELLAQSRGAGRDAPALDFSSISGMMKGFIDLIIEHDGRFFVLDYKSNHLGNSFDDYQIEHLNRAMDAHNYDFQYLIYTLALHRYLRHRIPDYSYAQHMGGVYYLFLRGMTAENAQSTGVYYDKPSFDLVDSLDALFAGQQREVADA